MIRRVLRRLIRGRPSPEAAPAPPPAPRAPDPPPAEEEPDIDVDAPVPGSLILDVREPGELASGVVEGALLIPMDCVPNHLADLPRDRPITVHCAAGARSFGVAWWLREQGFDAWSFRGGPHDLGLPMVRPEGAGRALRLPADTEVDGVRLGVPMDGEVVEPGRVRVKDAQGLQVVVRVA